MSVIAQHKVKGGIRFYGGAEKAWRYKGPELILSGPYETGKTFFGLSKLHALAIKYPNSQSFITRETYKSLLTTAIKTYENKVLEVPPDNPNSPIKKYGGSRPEFYTYPNSSQIIVVGMDNPDKLLSGEFDFGFVNQAEGIYLDGYEKLVGRCTGRAGNAPYTQIILDCNPGPPQHWILHRKELKLFEQLHEHNPVLFNQDTQTWTEQGKITIQRLQSLTGLRFQRGYLGKWVAAEGVVYEFLPNIHMINRADVPEIKSWYLAVDFGYTNPFVCQLWGIDADGRMYLWNEIYMSRRTVNAHIPAIKAMIGDRNIQAIVADHDAEDRATMHEYGLYTTRAIKDISVGIQTMQERLKIQGDGKPRLYICEDACIEYDSELYREYPGDLFPCSTEHEFPVYTWPESKEGRADKEVPLDLNNHGMDAARYIAMYLDNKPIIDFL